MSKQKVVLVDGNSLAYRAFFALPLLTNEQGIHTNATYGFTMMLQKIVEEEQPTHMLIAWDAGKTTFRHATFSEYKGGRQKTPPELSEQFAYIRQLVEAYQIPQYELDQYEADDIIGTLSKQAEQQGVETIVISGDKDLTQLASSLTTVQITRKGITDLEHYTPEHIQEKYGITPLQIIDMKGLMGDSSDNIPGVPGVGEKTAIKLLTAYESVEGVYAHMDEMKASKMKEKLVANEELAHISKQLATIERDAPVTVSLDSIQYPGPDMEKVHAIWQQLQFKTLLEKSSFQSDTKELTEVTYEVVTEWKPEQFEQDMALHIELYDDHYHTSAILAVGLIGEQGQYVMEGNAAFSDSLFKAWLEDESKLKRCYDVKAFQAVAKRFGCELKGASFDLLLAAYISDPSISSSQDLASLARHFGHAEVDDDEALYGKGAKKKAPEGDVLFEHVIRKTTAVWKLKDIVESKLKETEQYELYHNLELPLASVLGEMESFGVRVDRETLEKMGVELRGRLEQIEKRIHEMAGEDFNINSPKQLGVILFEKLGLPAIKKTKTGYSTAADVLEKLQGQHEIISEILLYRQLGKLQSTYIEGLLKEIHEDGKVHTRYQQALTSTGRLSSINPNLQNIPIRIEEGRKIRQAFVPSEEGWVLFAADYSQIELRVMAHMSQDDKLVRAFKEDRDIHTQTAMDVFGVTAEEVTSNMRRAAKAVNFGIIYGISDYGLSQSLSITRKEAATFIDNYLTSFPGVKQFMDNAIAEAKKHGFVTTIMNRRRYLPEITSSNFNLRGFAERTAMNTPIQGSAADIIKKAMIDMDRELEERGLKTKMLLQVHDELIFEVPVNELETIEQLVPHVMEHAVELSVPLKVDFAHGKTWYETK
ncbi:DNA polymerase I [Tetzosporium hominis]|uniref:DNA polymerase I n=1 Tax=Tetzosporium hominis TaxID=2020506 RepID=A0A264W0X5_9BACL|nr:DNA polymerase I [Tetzosporium hominis]OZS77240.1 DNA polymerase I [Tetzosporium hominis]